MSVSNADGTLRTWASVADLVAKFGEVSRDEVLPDRRLVQAGSYVFESLEHGAGCYAPWVRLGKRWPAALVRAAREAA